MFKKTYFFLFFLVLMYGLIPIILSELLGSNFLIGDIIDNNLVFDLTTLTVCSALFLSPFLQTNIKLPKFNNLGRYLEIFGSNIYIIYLFFLVILGFTLRLVGTDRSSLLIILSSTFIQGMGLVLILFYLKLIKSNLKSILLIAFLFILIDILFMGKQYFISLVTISIFLVDFHKIKFKIIHFILFLFISISFVFIINYTRGDFSEIDFFSSLMEFRGVVSSIQFASHDISFFSLGKFRTSIENTSIDVFGYNLAFHPLLFFRSISSFVFLNIFIYSLIVYLLFKFMIRQLGIYAILIFSLNFIHFLRHGIDIFLIKIIFQFLLVFIFRIKIISQQKTH